MSRSRVRLVLAAPSRWQRGEGTGSELKIEGDAIAIKDSILTLC